jgi:hypothetical protein
MHLGDLSRLVTQDDYERELSTLLGRKYVKSEGLKDYLTGGAMKHAVEMGSKRVLDGDIETCKKTVNSSTVWRIVKEITG